MFILNLFLQFGFLCLSNADELWNNNYYYYSSSGFNSIFLATESSMIMNENKMNRNLPPLPTAYYWNKEEYPDPLTDPYFCKQLKSSLLCDPDQMLNRTETEELQFQLEQYKKSNQCFCQKCPTGQAGIKIAIALARNIFVGYNDINNEAIQSFADHLHNRWRFGVCGDSILLLLVQSYLPNQSTLATSMGHVAKRIFSGEKFFQRLIYNNENETKNKKRYGTKEFDDEAKEYGDAAASFTGNGKGLGRNFQLLKSMLVAINEYVNNLDNVWLQNETNSMLALNPNEKTAAAEILSGEHHPDTRYTALIVLGTIIGFILFLTIIISAIILLKRHYEKELPVVNTPDNRQSMSTNADGYIPANIDEPEQEADEQPQQQPNEHFKTDANSELDNGQGNDFIFLETTTK